MRQVNRKMANSFLKAMHLDDSSYNYSFDHDKLEMLYFAKQINLSNYRDEDVKKFHRLSKRYNQLFPEIRKATKKELMHQFIDQIDKEVKLYLPPALRLACLYYGKSIRAYHYYKMSDYQCAIAVTKNCIDDLDTLIQQGVYTEINRMIQQNVNLCQVYFKMGDLEQVKTIWNGIFDYIFINKFTKRLYGKAFQCKRYACEVLPITEQHGMSWVSFLVTQIEWLEAQRFAKPIEFLDDVLGYYYNHVEITTIDRSAIYDWIAIKRLQYNGEKFDFLMNVRNFFRDYPYKQFRSLKRSLYLSAKDIFLEYGLLDVNDRIDVYDRTLMV